MSGSHTKTLPPLNGLNAPSSSWNDKRPSTSFFAPSSSSAATTNNNTNTNNSSENDRIPGDPVETPLIHNSTRRRTLFGSAISPAQSSFSNTNTSSASLEEQMALYTAQSTTTTPSSTTTTTTTTTATGPSHNTTPIPFGIRQRRASSSRAPPPTLDGNRRPPAVPPPKASRLSTLSVQGYTMESTSLVSDRRVDGVDHPQPNQTTNETPLLLNSPFLPKTNTPSTFNQTIHNDNHNLKQQPTMTPTTQPQSSKSPDYSKWIVVYGFTNAHQNRSVLNRFESFGTIVEQYPPTPSAPSSSSFTTPNNNQQDPLRNVDSNWVCLRYESDLQADKALCQHGSMFDATAGRQSRTGVGVGVGNGTNNEIVFIGVQRVDTDIAVRIGLRNYVEFGIRSIGIGGGGSGIVTHNNDDTEGTDGGRAGASSFQKPRVLLEETDVLWNGGGNTNGNGGRMVGTGYSGNGVGGTNVHGHPSGLVQYFLTWMFSW